MRTHPTSIPPSLDAPVLGCLVPEDRRFQIGYKCTYLLTYLLFVVCFIRFQPSVILRLLQLGANVHAKDIYGATALHYATLYQDITKYIADDNLVTALQQRGKGLTLCASPRENFHMQSMFCLLYTSPSPRDGLLSRMPSSA